MRETTSSLHGQIVEEDIELTLVELCRASGASEQQLTLWVAEGALDPLERHNDVPTGWRFGGSSLRRARIAVRLSRDLDIEPPGVALALDLLDQIERLRARLR
ncbi:chaperone modulator CbpM [Chitinasiproducens palmae]|uniref:Chaperone modulatory protein CbpM n=1 Tax=Chitinasiproducens palmae TaxID=1770053 RepID=A0A1H2PJZ9_9BURK|nr:chaperone modulator CbpM [Chitinasiproducens palmae]SDV46689.1 chaperone modulatory protein CbpM [Chitinasiproducens palmae]